MPARMPTPEPFDARALDFGIDAPGVRRMFVAIGGGALVDSAVLAAAERRGSSWRTLVVRSLLATVAAYGVGMAACMPYGSRLG